MTEKLLNDSVQKIAMLDPSKLEDAVSAFNLFRRGVTQASSNPEKTEEFLGALEPKAPALELLMDLYEKKKAYKKQIEAAFDVLMQVDAWVVQMSLLDPTSRLPDELRDLYQDRWDAYCAKPKTVAPPAAAPDPAPSAAASAAGKPADGLAQVSSALAEVDTALGAAMPAPAAPQPSLLSPLAAEDGSSSAAAEAPPPPSGTALIARGVALAKAHAAASASSAGGPARAPGSQGVLQDLSSSVEKLSAIDFSTEDRDRATEAFGLFMKTVNKISISSSKEDDDELDKVEHKDRILKFLTELHGKEAKYRSQIVSVLTRLGSLEAWQDAIQKDSSSSSLLDDKDAVKRTTSGISRPSGYPAAPAAKAILEDRNPVEIGPSSKLADPTALEAAFLDAEDESAKAAAEAPAPAPAPALGWAAWFSIDPRKGQLMPYPQELAMSLEKCWADSQESVDISWAGGYFVGARVEFRPYLLQRTEKGSRHVCRLEMREPGSTVTVTLDKNRHGTWERAKDTTAPTAEARSLQFPADKAVRMLKRGDYTERPDAEKGPALSDPAPSPEKAPSPGKGKWWPFSK